MRAHGMVVVLLLGAGCRTVQSKESREAPAPRSFEGVVQALEKDPQLAAYVATRGYRLGQPAAATATPDGKQVLYLQSGPRSDVRKLYLFEVAAGKEHELASAESLSGEGDHALTREEAAQRERMRLTARGLGTFSLSQDGHTALVPFGGKIYLVPIAGGKATALPAGAAPDFDPQLSPDGHLVASVRANEVYVQPAAGGKATRLTHGATASLTHGTAEFVAQEEMDRFHGFWWSPDSKRIAVEEADSSKVESYYIADPAHGEQAAEGSPYPRPGKANVAVRLGVVDASGAHAGGNPHWISWNRTAFPYLTRVDWPRGGPLLVQVESRDQKDLQLLSADPVTGATRTLLQEHDDAWINLHEDARWLPKSATFLWSTEREGQRNLELHAANGALLRRLTDSPLGFRRLIGVDEAHGFALVAASATSTDQSLYRVPLAGGAATLIAGGPSVHSATASDDGSVLVDREEQLESPARHLVLASKDGQKLGELPSQAEPFAQLPRVELTQVTTAHGMLNAAIVRPVDFSPHQHYPVIDWVYGGPGVVSVQRSAASYALQQWIADQGFVVVKIDNRGTPWRGRDFERVLKGSFADVPLGDQADGVTALAQAYRFMDLDRLGVIGASFGGYLSALAVLRRPDLFKAAVAIAPVVDWEDYDTHYTERYVGTPASNRDGYRKSSLLTGAEQLSRPLLLIHGTADDNVHFGGTLKLIQALESAGKGASLFLVPGQTHMFADQPTQKLLWSESVAFLAEHLE